MSSYDKECIHQNLEAKRQQNLEDNRRFLAALKINDIRDELKEATNNGSASAIGHKAKKKETKSDIIRRSSRIRHNIGQTENVPPTKQKKKNTDENRAYHVPKIKLQLPDHMLVRYQSTTKKVALHNTKAKYGDDDENSLT